MEQHSEQNQSVGSRSSWNSVGRTSSHSVELSRRMT